MSFRLTIAAISLLTCSTLHAQASAERRRDYDLVHQRIEVRGFDWDSTAFDGAVGTTVVSLTDGLEAVVLDMDRQLEVRAVTSSKKDETALRSPR